MKIAEREVSIGVFDSGLGGLTVLKEIMQRLPQESIVYFGDTARVPYGEKSPEAIIRYSIQNAIFLMEQQIKLLVVACNTASSYALDKLERIFNIPVVGVVDPGARRAVAVTRSGRIGVIGTKGTIASKSYQKALSALLPAAQVFVQPCPLLVPLVEEDFISHPATRLIVQEYLRTFQAQNIDTLLLGCTHYPLLQELIRAELDASVTIVDSASACADEVSRLLLGQQVESCVPPDRMARFFVSDDPDKFKRLGSLFLGKEIADVSCVDIR